MITGVISMTKGPRNVQRTTAHASEHLPERKQQGLPRKQGQQRHHERKSSSFCSRTNGTPNSRISPRKTTNKPCRRGDGSSCGAVKAGRRRRQYGKQDKSRPKVERVSGMKRAAGV